jgi:hypothetical protein
MLRLASATLLTLALWAAPAAANEFCDKEMAPLVQQRASLTSKLNAISKNPKAPNARQQFCGTLTSYIGNIRKLISYMEQNKDFCGVPDDAIDMAKKGLTQNQSMHHKVCVAQAQPQQQQQQQSGAGGGRPTTVRPPVELRLQ